MPGLDRQAVLYVRQSTLRQGAVRSDETLVLMTRFELPGHLHPLASSSNRCQSALLRDAQTGAPVRSHTTCRVEPSCSADSCRGDLRLVDGGDSAAGRLERRYDDRAWT